MGLWELSTGAPTRWWQLPRAVSLVGGTGLVGLGFALNLVWRRLWRRFPMLNRLIFPDLNGSWNGEHRSNWRDPESGARAPPGPANLDIKLGVFDISVRLKTDKAQSYSSRVSLEREKGTPIFRVWYSYAHRPRPEYRAQNPPHEGMAYLEYNTDQPDRLYCQYYTNRETSGELKLRRD